MTELANIKVQNYYSPAKALGTYSSPAQSTNSPAAASVTELQAWMDKAKAYYEAVISGDPSTPKPSAQDWAQFLDEWKYAQTQLQGGDPTAGSDWSPPMQAPQDMAPIPEGAKQGLFNNLTWSQSASTLTFDGNDTRAQDIWSKTNVLRATDLSVTVNATLTQDTRLQPSQEVLKVVMHDTGTGQETTYFYHDLNKLKDKHIDFNTVSDDQPPQDQIDAINQKYPGLVSRSTYDPTAPTTPDQKAPVSEPAPEMINGEQWWKKGNAVNYVMTPGTSTDRLRVGTVDLNSDDTTYKVKITKVSAHHYTIEYTKEDGTPLRTIDADQVSSLDFKGLYAGNVTYIDNNASPAVSGTWDSFTTSPDAQIQVEGSSLNATPNAGTGANGTPAPTGPLKKGDVVNTDATNDSPLDDVDLTKHTATYNTSDPAELTALYSDDPNAIQTYDISDARQVILHSGDKNDKVRIVQESGKDDYVVTFTSHGKDQVFIVHGNAKIQIDANPDNIFYSGKEDTGNYTPGIDPKITVTGEEFPKYVSDLKTYLQGNGNKDIGEADITKVIRDQGMSNVELLHPVIPPNKKFIDFLLAVDPDFRDLKNGMDYHNDNSKGQVRDHLLELMKIFYPNTEMHANSGGGDHMDDIVISGQGYDIIDEGNGGDIHFSSY